jgi:hypothetical protein
MHGEREASASRLGPQQRESKPRGNESCLAVFFVPRGQRSEARDQGTEASCLFPAENTPSCSEIIVFRPRGQGSNQKHRVFAQGAKMWRRGQAFLGVPLGKGNKKTSARTGSAERDKSRRYRWIKLSKNSPQKCRREYTHFGMKTHAVASPIIAIFEGVSEGIFGRAGILSQRRRERGVRIEARNHVIPSEP